LKKIAANGSAVRTVAKLIGLVFEGMLGGGLGWLGVYLHCPREIVGLVSPFFEMDSIFVKF